MFFLTFGKFLFRARFYFFQNCSPEILSERTFFLLLQKYFLLVAVQNFAPAVPFFGIWLPCGHQKAVGPSKPRANKNVNLFWTRRSQKTKPRAAYYAPHAVKLGIGSKKSNPQNRREPAGAARAAKELFAKAPGRRGQPSQKALSPQSSKHRAPALITSRGAVLTT